MGIEIEHKFLVTSPVYKNLAEPVRYRQGYLFVSPAKTVRVRVAGNQGAITVKAGISGLIRKEFEYGIPVTDAEEMINELCTGSIIEKNRYRIPYEGFVWEVDEFLGDNAGLVVAEIELHSEGQEFQKPDWIGPEITGKREYLNSYLSVEPFNSWPK